MAHERVVCVRYPRPQGHHLDSEAACFQHAHQLLVAEEVEAIARVGDAVEHEGGAVAPGPASRDLLDHQHASVGQAPGGPVQKTMLCLVGLEMVKHVTDRDDVRGGQIPIKNVALSDLDVGESATAHSRFSRVALETDYLPRW